MSNGHGNGNGEKRYVSPGELDSKLTATRWEMRFLILAAIVANQVLPAADIGKTALRSALAAFT